MNPLLIPCDTLLLIQGPPLQVALHKVAYIDVSCTKANGQWLGSSPDVCVGSGLSPQNITRNEMRGLMDYSSLHDPAAIITGFFSPIFCLPVLEGCL